MRRIFSLVILIAFGFTVSHAQGGYYTEERSVGSFNKIDACCGIDVFITEGTSTTVRVEINDQEYMSRVITETIRDELRIAFDNKLLGSKRPNNLKIKVYITASNLTRIKASSGSDVRSEGQLNAQDIELSSSSGSDLILDLKAVNIKGESSSGSDLKLKGKATYADLSSTSGSDIDAKDMTISRVDAASSTGSDIKVTVVDEINAKASTGADVIYYGNPKTVNNRKSTGGSIKHRN